MQTAYISMPCKLIQFKFIALRTSAPSASSAVRFPWFFISGCVDNDVTKTAIPKDPVI